jgi:hypothetical protein
MLSHEETTVGSIFCSLFRGVWNWRGIEELNLFVFFYIIKYKICIINIIYIFKYKRLIRGR